MEGHLHPAVASSSAPSPSMRRPVPPPPNTNSPAVGRRPVPPPPPSAVAKESPASTSLSPQQSPRDVVSPSPVRHSATFARASRPAGRAPGTPLPPPPPGVVRPPPKVASPDAPPTLTSDAPVVAGSVPVAVLVSTPSSNALPKVKAPLSEEEMARKRAQVCQEIVETEDRYLAQLRLIINEYEKKLLDGHVLTPLADKLIFINVGALAQLHDQVLESLRSSDVGVALCGISPGLTLYTEYVNKFNEASTTLRKLTAENKKFARALEKCHHANLNGLSGLETLLVVPVQRIPRYVLLLREVLKFTPETHADYAKCRQAFEEMEKVAGLINEKKREYDQLQRLVFVSSHLTGGNLGALRSTAKNLGKKHDFVSTRIVLPYVCDYSKEVCHFEMYVCQTCGYRAHKSCYQQVPPTCSDEKVIERDSQPELIRTFRKILREEVIMHKVTRMDKLKDYESTPFESKSLLLCNDSACVLKVEGEANATNSAGSAAPADDIKYSLVDLVKWSSSVVSGPNAVLNDQVAPELFSLSNRRSNLLHTFKCNTPEEKASWVKSFRDAMEKWNASVIQHEEQEQLVTEQLTGLQFNISGTIPVASAFEKPFTVFIIEMTNNSKVDGHKISVTILKRYRQLLALHHRLCEIYGEDKLPSFPRKKLIGNTDEKFLQKRSRQLTQYLQGIVKLEGILKHPEVRTFLTTTVSGKNEDELVPAFGSSRDEVSSKAVASIIESDEEDDAVAPATSISPRKQENRKSVSDADDEGFSAGLSSLGFGAKPKPDLSDSNRKSVKEVDDDDGPETAVMLYDYDGKQEGSMALQRGSIVVVLKKADGWWWCVAKDGRTGYLPADFLDSDSS